MWSLSLAPRKIVEPRIPRPHLLEGGRGLLHQPLVVPGERRSVGVERLGVIFGGILSSRRYPGRYNSATFSHCELEEAIGASAITRALRCG